MPSAPPDSVRLEYLHEAPDGDYTPAIGVEYGPDSMPYVRQFDGLFYIKSRNGRVYAKLRFDMNTFWDERGIPFGISAIVNTNASRNLQTPVGQ